MLSRKHYVAVAKILRKEIEDPAISDSTKAVGAICNIADGLATMFKQDNPAFDHARFNAAAGVM